MRTHIPRFALFTLASFLAACSGIPVVGGGTDASPAPDVANDLAAPDIPVTPDAGDDPERPCAVVRAFAAPMGNNEDPATGSLNASLAQWLIAEGLAPTHYLASQGESLGRAARIRIAQDSYV